MRPARPAPTRWPLARRASKLIAAVARQRRLATAAALVTAVAVASCAGPAGVLDAGPAPRRPAGPHGTGAIGPGAEATIYLVRGTELVPAVRPGPAGTDDDLLLAGWIDLLLQGPTAAEAEAGLTSAIPAGTRLLGARVDPDSGIADLDLSGELEAGGTTEDQRIRLGQLVCTARSPVGGGQVTGVRLQLDGRPVVLVTGDGVRIDRPATCGDYLVGATTGAPSARCRDGWSTPAPGEAARTRPLDLIRASAGTDQQFVVEAMRRFTGPTGPGDGDGEWWYARVRGTVDPTFRGRFLVVSRDGSGGVAAIAGADTRGFGSPDWAGFEGDGDLVAYPDLPGRWGGVRYDFVTGEGGPGRPGLPDAVVGCLDGT